MAARPLAFLYLLLMQESAGESAPADPTGVLEPAAKAGSLLFNMGVAGTITVLLLACALLIRWWKADKALLNGQLSSAMDALSKQSSEAHDELKTQMKEQHEREKEYIAALNEFRRSLDAATAEGREAKAEVRELKGTVVRMEAQVSNLAAQVAALATKR